MQTATQNKLAARTSRKINCFSRRRIERVNPRSGALNAHDLNRHIPDAGASRCDEIYCYQVRWCFFRWEIH